MEKNDKWILLLTFLLGWLVAEMPSANSVEEFARTPAAVESSDQWQQPWVVATAEQPQQRISK